jgi:hypothetical protein
MKKVVLIIAIFLPSLIIAKEQIETKHISIKTDSINTQEKKGFKEFISNLNFGAGVSVSTNGFGINLVTEINDKLNIRLGYEYISLTLKKRGLRSGRHFYYIDPKYKTGGFSLIGEYKVYKSFYVAAGIVQTTMSVDLKMKLNGNVNFGDIIYTPEEVGQLSMKLKPKNKVAPYLAVGWSPQIFRNEKLKLNFEVGMYYINSFKAKMSGTNMLAANGQGSVEKFNDEVSSMNWTKFYPIGKIGFSYMFY